VNTVMRSDVSYRRAVLTSRAVRCVRLAHGVYTVLNAIEAQEALVPHMFRHLL
jgi:hypothetical protein